MPTPEHRKDGETSHEDSRDLDRDRERDKDKSGKAKGPAKTKDLSHVPCKFFKVGSCTAGSSCPFSHNVLEPGQQKEVCAWFVKGNCKFGHKCALAHILPGQSMSMDRKNKKAAQLAANASNSGGSSGRGGRSGKSGHGSGGNQARNPLLSGSTAPTRAASNSRPNPLKATLSPSTPAPPVKDTDFASFGLPDESNKLPSAPAQGKPDAQTNIADASLADHSTSEDLPKAESGAPSPLPMSTPRHGAQHGSPNGADLGPIGSPPRASPARVNGFTAGTSPTAAGLSTSPFSAPHTQSVFTLHEADDTSHGLKARSGLSASLGTSITWSTERGARGVAAHGVANDVVVEDEDLEDFLPSSLTDLLTPEERSRRLSRTNGARPTLVSPEQDAGLPRPVGEGHHRYSRSVPAPSLLQDIRSIWADNGAAANGDAGATLGGGLGNGTPSSFTSNSGLGRPGGEEMLAPSNASAAFLPGLHHHYFNAKTQRSNLLSALTSTSHGASHGAYPGAYGAGLNSGALSPPRTSALNSTSDMYYPNSMHRGGSGRPIPSGDGFLPDSDDRRSALSPSALALQAHAPGQSLPQGLAAGYSRIHALPPPPSIASPSTPGAFSHLGGFSPGTKGFGHGQSASGEWHSMSPGAGNTLDQVSMSPNFTMQASGTAGSANLGGLEAHFSRLSYSAAATRGTGVGARVPSGRGYNPQAATFSPLSGPVLTGDDDDLFSMDG